MPASILDASALLALPRDETGVAEVSRHIDEAVMTSVNVGEVARRMFSLAWTRAAFNEVVTALGLTVVDVDLPLAIDAAEMEAVTREIGLSNADRLCIALGRRTGMPILTGDQDWRKVQDRLEIDPVYFR